MRTPWVNKKQCGSRFPGAAFYVAENIKLEFVGEQPLALPLGELARRKA